MMELPNQSFRQAFMFKEDAIKLFSANSFCAHYEKLMIELPNLLKKVYTNSAKIAKIKYGPFLVMN